MPEKVRVKIKRQKSPNESSYWEEFDVAYRPNMNVTILLQDIRRNPVTVSGQKTSPVVWDCSCLEEVCGVCTMVVNGKVRQSCTALVDSYEQPIVLEPMRKFPVIRDLSVDRSRMFEALKRVKAWVPIDGTHGLGVGPRLSQEEQELRYDLSRCITCGCCLDACPQVNDRSDFIGAAAISQVHLFNLHPTGKMNKHERFEALMGPGGIQDCGNAQNCVRACPKDIPLTDSIAAVNRGVLGNAVRSFLTRKK